MFKVGKRVQLVCEAMLDTFHIDTPVRSIFNWYHHGNQTILTDHRIHISSSPLQSVIIFAPLLMEDKGTIQCAVSLEAVGAGKQNGFILPSEEGTAALTLEVEGDLIYKDMIIEFTLSRTFHLLLEYYVYITGTGGSATHIYINLP